MAVSDIAGDVVWQSEYSPFGEQTGTVGVLADPGKFTGKDLDRDTGLYYYNARWYDSGTGRFISEDPVKDGGNWYVYGNNSPLRFVDPTGLWTISDYTASFDGHLNFYNENGNNEDASAGQLMSYDDVNNFVENNPNVPDNVMVNVGGEMIAMGEVRKMDSYNNMIIESGLDDNGEYDSTSAENLLSDGHMSFLEAQESLNEIVDISTDKNGKRKFKGKRKPNLIEHWSVRYVLNFHDELLKNSYWTKRVFGKPLYWMRRNSLNEEVSVVWRGKKWYLMPKGKSMYHGENDNAEKNLKWVSEDGRELVISQDGQVVMDPRFIGTFNFIPLSANFWGHTDYDVKPYENNIFLIGSKGWGNQPDDSIKHTGIIK